MGITHTAADSGKYKYINYCKSATVYHQMHNDRQACCERILNPDHTRSSAVTDKPRDAPC